MCGRYTLTADRDSLLQVFQLEEVDPTYQARYNIAPGQQIPVVAGREKRKLGMMKWGLIPSWAKESQGRYKMINARAETLAEKPAFSRPFFRQRCLVPADGFYEWKKDGDTKYPLRIVLPDYPLFAFAGLWDRWISPGGEEIISCCIVTTGANSFMEGIHHRMPAILAGPGAQGEWLNPGEPKPMEKLKELLQPFQGKMEAYQVSSLVSSSRFDTPQCIARADQGAPAGKSPGYSE